VFLITIRIRITGETRYPYKFHCGMKGYLLIFFFPEGGHETRGSSLIRYQGISIWGTPLRFIPLPRDVYWVTVCGCFSDSVLNEGIPTSSRTSFMMTISHQQVKSEEYARFHCDQEDQIDDFKRLKKMIHENGLPSIEQVVALLRQVNAQPRLNRTAFHWYEKSRTGCDPNNTR